MNPIYEWKSPGSWKNPILLKSLVTTIKVNEIFPFLACYGQNLNFFSSEIETKINARSVKGSFEDEIESFLKKWYIRSVVTDFC